MSAPKTTDKAPATEEIDLTPFDEDALDKAWDTITDADIEASIKWLDEVDNDDADQE